eukprot:6204450-Pleurochrysis_carterae.AAC.1
MGRERRSRRRAEDEKRSNAGKDRSQSRQGRYRTKECRAGPKSGESSDVYDVGRDTAGAARQKAKGERKVVIHSLDACGGAAGGRAVRKRDAQRLQPASTLLSHAQFQIRLVIDRNKTAAHLAARISDCAARIPHSLSPPSIPVLVWQPQRLYAMSLLWGLPTGLSRRACGRQRHRTFSSFNREMLRRAASNCRCNAPASAASLARERSCESDTERQRSRRSAVR